MSQAAASAVLVTDDAERRAAILRRVAAAVLDAAAQWAEDMGAREREGRARELAEHAATQP